MTGRCGLSTRRILAGAAAELSGKGKSAVAPTPPGFDALSASRGEWRNSSEASLIKVRGPLLGEVIAKADYSAPRPRRHPGPPPRRLSGLLLKLIRPLLMPFERQKHEHEHKKKRRELP